MSLTVDRLRCEYAANPLGIDALWGQWIAYEAIKGVVVQSDGLGACSGCSGTEEVV